MEDLEEYSPDGVKGGLQTTPEGLRRRRMTYYEDRSDLKSRCLRKCLCLWDLVFYFEILIQVLNIILCSLVAQNASLRQGDEMDVSMLKGFVAGLGVFVIIWLMWEFSFRCSDEKTHQRTVRNESSPCVQFVYCLNVLILVSIVCAWIGVKKYCKEGTPCILFDY
jgi:hypothetical protein